jgi:UDP-N-acetylmuramate--alanine ligase
MHIHFIGIGGTGLSAIATVLLERGLTISGSDRRSSPILASLEQAGARITIGHHRAENVAGADLVVRSSAVRLDNVEVQAAQAAGIPVLRREEFLEQLIGSQRAIAVAGTHGKTTTTSMIAWMLTAMDQDPSYVIGGVATNLGTNAHAGQGNYFVIEADEYDRMFLGLSPYLAVVTNIEHDHPDCYPTPQDFSQAFDQFAQRLLPDGTLLACADDPGAAALLAGMRREGRAGMSYGLSAKGCELQAVAPAPNAAGGFSFDVRLSGKPLLEGVSLQVPGRHNVRNALAAIGVAYRLGLPVLKASQALSQFRGASRRFEVRGEPGGILLVDDYAHHPTEIRATLNAARARYPSRRIWAVWQPHTYSRLRTLFNEFSLAFDAADCVLVTDVYAARESAPEDGFSALNIVRALNVRRSPYGRPVQGPLPVPAAQDWLEETLQPGDVVLVLSAGDADQITAGLLEALGE